MGNEMNLKIKFSLILIGWILLISIASILASNGNNFFNKDDDLVPLPDFNRDPSKKIIIRVDDVGAYHLDDVSINIIDNILDRRMALSAAVIPKDIEKDRKLVDFIKSKINNPNFEIAQHGTNHTVNEFLELNEQEAYDLIKIGREKLIKTFSYSPVTFIPPYNEYSEDTVKALSELGYRVMSGKRNESRNESLLIIGYDVRTKDIGKEGLNPVEDVIEGCKNALNSKDLCVIMIHPSDYVKDGKFVYKNEFLDLLNNLWQLNATFVTFNNIVK